MFSVRWLADRHFCRVVYLVRHPAGIVSSLKRIGTRWSDNLPDIAAQPELIKAYLSDFSDDVAQVVSALGLGRIVGFYAAGRAVDRRGERRVLVLGAVGTGACVAVAVRYFRLCE